MSNAMDTFFWEPSLILKLESDKIVSCGLCFIGRNRWSSKDPTAELFIDSPTVLILIMKINRVK